MKHIFLSLILCCVSLTGCSSEDREAITDKEAQHQIERIRQPIDQAKDAAKLVERHNQQQLPD